jgi:predicted component of type VI protein secretion system
LARPLVARGQERRPVGGGERGSQIMIALRLFHRNDPFRQIESREVAEGELVIGRDPGPGWTIEDPSMTLSRRHCVIALSEGGLTLRDTSANGVFLGRERVRIPPGPAIPLDGETIHLGEFLIIADPKPDEAAASSQPDCPLEANRPAPPVGEAAASSQPDCAPEANRLAPPVSEAANQGALLDLFCQGAGLEVSAFYGEDPSQVLLRAGAVYRQMVQGLVALMEARTRVRGEYWMDQTSVKAQDNNPFRWAHADRVAVDLLRDTGSGFLVGPAAVKASFADLENHFGCVMSGMRGALRAVFEALSPAALERNDGGMTLLKPRAASSWSAFLREHERLRGLADDDVKSPINKAFRNGYERRLGELDRRRADR